MLTDSKIFLIPQSQKIFLLRRPHFLHLIDDISRMLFFSFFISSLLLEVLYHIIWHKDNYQNRTLIEFGQDFIGIMSYCVTSDDLKSSLFSHSVKPLYIWLLDSLVLSGSRVKCLHCTDTRDELGYALFLLCTDTEAKCLLPSLLCSCCFVC